MVGLSLQGMLPIVFTYTLDALMAKFWEPVPSSQQLATQEQRMQRCSIRRMSGAKTFFQRICHIGRICCSCILLPRCVLLWDDATTRFERQERRRPRRMFCHPQTFFRRRRLNQGRMCIYRPIVASSIYYFYIETCHGASELLSIHNWIKAQQEISDVTKKAKTF